MVVVDRIAAAVVFWIDICRYAGYSERSNVWLAPAACE